MALGAIIAVVLAYRAYRAQIKQSQVELWRSLSKEFDHDLIEVRSRCVDEFRKWEGKGGKMEGVFDAAQPIMDFFESVAYLIKEDLIPNELAKHTWQYYFSGYFIATERFIRTDQSDDPTFYEDVRWLYDKKWGADRTISKKELRVFFNAETEVVRSHGKKVRGF